MSAIESELKQMIVDVLGLEDVRPEDIGSEENLFDDVGLALDSIDALELGVTIQKKYGVKIDPQDKNVASHFQTVRALADFIGAK
ncbi:MAG: phosphopantetheine-binding protein [Alphaproteobacteria bacterium]|nr:phosphopantetheine-binding protein [Alphaproteobacteria bacterium]